MELDNLNKEIINILIENSTLSYRKIAKRINVSVATVMHRVKKLEKEGILRTYTAIVDYEKAGYDIEVLVECRISKGMLIEVERKIATDPNVFAVYDLTGDFDAAILARFKNRRKMDNFLKKIQTYDFVERTNTRLILNTIKEKRINVE